MDKSSHQDVERILRQSRIIWPGVIDAWIIPVLDSLVAAPCPGPYTDFFLIRDARPGNHYICEPKEYWLKRAGFREPS
jgi:hypothetical protein